jgi:hypothetical protein
MTSSAVDHWQSLKEQASPPIFSPSEDKVHFKLHQATPSLASNEPDGQVLDLPNRRLKTLRTSTAVAVGSVMLSSTRETPKIMIPPCCEVPLGTIFRTLARNQTTRTPRKNGSTGKCLLTSFTVIDAQNKTNYCPRAVR